MKKVEDQKKTTLCSFSLIACVLFPSRVLRDQVAIKKLVYLRHILYVLRITSSSNSHKKKRENHSDEKARPKSLTLQIARYST